jgi:regulator of nonsense transcripts 2
VKLVCAVLDTCGPFFNEGPDEVLLDHFLVYFQLYLLNKQQPLPVDLDIALFDTFDALRPKLKMFETVDEATAAVAVCL